MATLKFPEHITDLMDSVVRVVEEQKALKKRIALHPADSLAKMPREKIIEFLKIAIGCKFKLADLPPDLKWFFVAGETARADKFCCLFSVTSTLKVAWAAQCILCKAEIDRNLDIQISFLMNNGTLVFSNQRKALAFIDNFIAQHKKPKKK